MGNRNNKRDCEYKGEKSNKKRKYKSECSSEERKGIRTSTKIKITKRFPDSDDADDFDTHVFTWYAMIMTMTSWTNNSQMMG